MGMARALLLGALVVATAACAGRREATTQPNILVVSLDALRADHLSCYGYDRPTSPVLDRLAAGGTRFSHAFANTHGTPPSHTTLFSSLYQETHGVDLVAEDAKQKRHHVPPEVGLVQEILRNNGWRTVGVTGGGYMASEFGFARGFEEFSDRARGVDDGARQLADRVCGEAADNRPVFAFLHTYEVHSPYEPPDEYARLFVEREGAVEVSNEALVAIQNQAAKVLTREDFEYLESLYDGEIRYTDTVLERLFSELETCGFLDGAVVIVTSDHGEEFGEHGGLLHRGTLYEELIHVPLIIAGAGVEVGVVDPALVSLIDVAPTILTVAGLPVPGVMEGRSLLSRPPVASWPDQSVFSQYGSHLYSIRTPRWKLIDRPAVGRSELFDLRRDPGETRDVAAEQPEVARKLLDELMAWRQARSRRHDHEGPAAEISEATRNDLRALGYAE